MKIIRKFGVSMSKKKIDNKAKSKKATEIKTTNKKSVAKKLGALNHTTKMIIYTATASAIVLPTAIFATYAITKAVVTDNSGGLNPGGNNPDGNNPDGNNPGGNNPGGSIPGGSGTPA